MKKHCFLFLFFIPLTLFSQRVDHQLEKKLKEAIGDYHGQIGVYVKNLRTGKTVAIHADTIFPTASIVKVPILVGIMDKMEKKELGYDSLLTYKDSLLCRC